MNFAIMLQNYRSHMTAEAKKAAKLEKKMKVLLGGYQSRSQALIKGLTETADLVDDAYVERDTFDAIREHERLAIPARIDVGFCHFGEGKKGEWRLH